MSNSLLNISMITREALRELKNQLAFTKGVNRQYDDSFAQKGAKIGSVINIRKPVRFSVTDGSALSIQNVADQSVALTLDKRKHVGFQFTTQDLTLSIDDFRQRYIAPAITALANQIDLDGLALYKKVWNQVGAAGTTPATLAVALSAGQKLDENGCPADDNRSIVLNPAGQAGIVGGLSTLFNSVEQLKKQYEKGVMGMAAGFTWKMDQNVAVHTVGALGGTPLNKTNVADGDSSFTVTGGSNNITGYFKEGDVITFASVYAVNPVTKQSTGSLMQFVVTADANTNGSGEGTVSVSPSFTLSGAYQNVSALPLANAAIKTFDQVSSSASKVSPANLAYHRDAFVLGMADLELPGGVDMASRATDPESGLSIRLVRDYDINNDVMPVRLDVLYGWKAVYPELACRIQG